MADTKLVKLAGEHWVCSVMARHGWGVALTRDGLEHADVLGVHSWTRHLVEVQVKTASFIPRPNWPLNLKAQEPARSDREWFVLVALGRSASEGTRGFVVPRDHVAAATWISHEDWRTDPGVAPGKRNAGVDKARVKAAVFERYLERWDLLLQPSTRCAGAAATALSRSGVERAGGSTPRASMGRRAARLVAVVGMAPHRRAARPSFFHSAARSG